MKQTAIRWQIIPHVDSSGENMFFSYHMEPHQEDSGTYHEVE